MTTEAEFEAAVVELAHMFGWSAMAVRTSVKGKGGGYATAWKYDGVGWPDLTLVHPDRRILVFAELKRDRKNQPTGDQRTWLARLARLTHEDQRPTIVVDVWTPEDADRIASLLSAGKVTQWRP